MPQDRNKELLRRISVRIKQLRAKEGLTQEDVYHDTGINISRIERAINDLSVSTLERLCSYLGISLEEFFSAQEPSLGGHPKKRESKKSRSKKKGS